MKEVLLLIIVCSPVDLTSHVPTHVNESWWTALKRVGTALEVSGPDCHWNPNFRYEVAWVRDNWSQCRGFPSIADCDKFPPQHVCQRNAYWTCQYLTWLRRAQRERLHWSVADHISTAERVSAFWIAASSSQWRNHMAWSSRRRYLQDAKQAIGDELYSSGRWPNPVPQWFVEHLKVFRAWKFTLIQA